MLATHVDGLLRKKALCRKYNEQEIEERLFGIINLLKYIDSKDLFMRHHKVCPTQEGSLSSKTGKETGSSVLF